MIAPVCFVDGQWVLPTTVLDQWVCDPNDGAELFEPREAPPELVDRAIAVADAAHATGEWADASPVQRAVVLRRIADALAARADEISRADAMTTGVVVRLTDLLATVVPHTFRAAAVQLEESTSDARWPGPHGDVDVVRLPLGPAAVIAPWNAPSVIASHKIASALAAGCPVLLKPSEHAPVSCQLVAECVASAELPHGVFQLVQGGPRVGAQLARDPRVRAVSFTGGLTGGRAVAAACARGMKPAQLELGGNNPMIVLEDADLQAAADGVVAGLTTMNGQWCRALGRLLVHDSVAAPLLDRVAALLAAIRLGSSLERDSQMGPLVHAGHREFVAGAVAELVAAGGTSIQPTPMPDLPGSFYPPTLVTGVASEHALDEVFGPVATVHEFTTDAEALALANQTQFGLACYVFGAEARARALGERIRAGVVKVNGVGLLALHPLAPRPAWGLSGLGDEGVRETMEFFRGTRVIGVAGRPGESEQPSRRGTVEARP